jgi:hypothetical protein
MNIKSNEVYINKKYKFEKNMCVQLKITFPFSLIYKGNRIFQEIKGRLNSKLMYCIHFETELKVQFPLQSHRIVTESHTVKSLAKFTVRH